MTGNIYLNFVLIEDDGHRTPLKTQNVASAKWRELKPGDSVDIHGTARTVHRIEPDDDGLIVEVQ